ncbi:Fur family transcriptional regulator [Adhaeretor mobilis]|uniref:Ferric uptake regulation protein n=1 Tax=Adhaeretor mobilis TaxID=1930276 RepID=A0A517MYQ8_9BACT|nr:transcriptional repressor [Adhaeretor mobilis]QDS99999.1 Ferric uptake regulation protein [Adhaeretor mobilis]
MDTASADSAQSAYALGAVTVASSPQERFSEYLQSKGKRITQQRRILVDHVFERHDHFDADELIANLSRSQQECEEGRKVSRPTVYRTLNELVEAGLLRRMTLSGRSVYEHDYGYPQHDHLHCTKCDKLIEFQSEELKQLRQAVANEHGFRVTGHRLIVSGICEPCGRNRHRGKSPLDLI